MSQIPATLPEGLVSYARSPDFTDENLPAKLQSAHRVKPGTWALIHVLEGRLHYELEPPRQGEVTAAAGERIVIEEDTPHHVAFVEPGRIFIEFFRKPG
ncbi:DUF1971 domain-containing protein [Paracoccus sp. (in: a-proteobacteria)]|uniref:DUF1971 domain-containing protein n=1 Tax=Paracoccus sp. TaxID=267 RepID=UPI00321F92BD